MDTPKKKNHYALFLGVQFSSYNFITDECMMTFFEVLITVLFQN